MAEEITVPISDTNYYAMPDLNMSAWPEKNVTRGGCAVGDILYTVCSGSSHATDCVVVTRVTPAQVHTEGVMGTARFYVEPGDALFPAHRILKWAPDPGRRTGEAIVFRWGMGKEAYINGMWTLVRCTDTPAANYGEYKEGD